MIKGMRLSYTPLNLDGMGSISADGFLEYLRKSPWSRLIEKYVIDTFDEALKKSGPREFDFGDFKVTVKQKKGSSTGWKEIYEKIKTFLEIRGDDSRVAEFKDLKYMEGVGYCISIDSVLEEISQRKDESTSPSLSLAPEWPPIKKEDPKVREIEIPDIDYSKIDTHAALVAMKARRFKKSLEEEVIDAFKEANKIWMKGETRYSKENIPPKDISPVARVRYIGDNMYILINLVREENPNYKSIIGTITKDLIKIKSGERSQMWDKYRPTSDGFVNIKRFSERLAELYEQSIKPDVRFEIVP